jgi:O-antigen/teichoic acid export membrane protein
VSLSRFYLLSVPISLILNNLIAIDHGQGNFWRLNLVRHIFSYAFLVLVSILWFAKIVDVRFFLLAMIIANALVLAYRWNAVSRDTGAAATASLTLRKLFRQGGPFFVTNNVMILNENIERLLLIFLLGPAALGLYVVASTASTAHLNISKALNLVVFARSAGLERERSFVDVARILRKMAIVNLLLSIAMAVALPFLIRLFYGRQFSGAIGAALLLLVAQYFLSQAHVVQEAFRGQSQPFVGLAGVLIGMSVFMCTGYFLALRHGILGVAFSSIFGNISFYSFMLWMLKRTAPSARLWPIRADFAEIYSVIEQGWASVRLRLVRRLERWSP